ncbi:hypothetical protein Pelo_7618 [Pelomyxa schiedti]|nr:hypothetical protein Pelo_7618 [Pelomyxa schiedti]
MPSKGAIYTSSRNGVEKQKQLFDSWDEQAKYAVLRMRKQSESGEHAFIVNNVEDHSYVAIGSFRNSNRSAQRVPIYRGSVIHCTASLHPQVLLRNLGYQLHNQATQGDTTDTIRWSLYLPLFIHSFSCEVWGYINPGTTKPLRVIPLTPSGGSLRKR